MKLESPLAVKPHGQRRAALARTLKRGIVILPTAPEVTRNADSHYDYRWDSHFYYLTGFREPEAVVVMKLAGKANKKSTSILFCREKNLEREIWDGWRFGPAMAKESFAFDEAYPIGELDQRLPALMADEPTVHTPVGADGQWDARITGWLNAVRAQSRSGVSAPEEIRDVRATLSAMRLIKDGHEAAIMRRAGEIASAAHVRAMRFARGGQREYEVEAELMHEFLRNGAGAAYGSIVASGANACVLHYRENSAEMKAGDLLLIDAGCELGSYASDITRTFPIGTKFSGPQKDVYELVLASQLASIKAVKPGAGYNDFHEAAVKVLARGFIDLKLCKGTVDAVIESGAFRQFYMHRTGHWLGLDVHDAGEYKSSGKWVKLRPGMVVTVEPGCYIRPGPKAPKALWNIGVRIEDDVLVTAKGHDVLSKDCPKSVAEIEALTTGRG
jgi:Xaa-Pro aminopeptidase